MSWVAGSPRDDDAAEVYLMDLRKTPISELVKLGDGLVSICAGQKLRTLFLQYDPMYLGLIPKETF